MRTTRLLRGTFAALLTISVLAAQWRAQIDNPGAGARTAWVEGLGIPKTLLPEHVPLVGTAGDREIGFRYVRETGTHWIYTGEVECRAGERVIDVTNLRPDAHRLAGGTRYPLDRPFVYADGLAQNGMARGFVGELVVHRGDGESRIPMPWARMDRIVATEQVTAWKGWRPWGRYIVDWWITIHSRSPVARLQVVVTCDDLEQLELDIRSVTLTYGAELTSRWAKALATPITWDGSSSSVTWTVPAGKITRCTAPFQFDGQILFPGAADTQRAGPLRAVLDADTLDGHVPPFGPVPRWDGSAATVAGLVADLDTYLGGGSTSWLSERQFGSEYNPNDGGDENQFGAVQCPELYGPGGVQLLGWMLNDASGDLGLRCLHHLDPAKPWNVWRWAPDSATKTWDDKPDDRATPAGPAMLGPILPETNSFGCRNFNSEHYGYIGASLYGLTGDCVLGYLVRNRFQLALAYRRRTDPWPGVPRATGRFVKWIVQAGEALDEIDKARACAEDILRVAIAESSGTKGDAGAYLKPILAMGRYYPKPQLAIGPWQEGLGLLGLLAAWIEWRDEWAGTQLLEDLERLMLDSARTSIRIATVSETEGVGWPYKLPYTDGDQAEAQAAIDSEVPSFNELNSKWPIACAAVFLTLGQESDPEWAKAQAIFEWSKHVASQRDARWTALVPVAR